RNSRTVCVRTPMRRRLLMFFFFQAEDGIRDWSVTGVQTCALPISGELHQGLPVVVAIAVEVPVQPLLNPVPYGLEEERRNQHYRHQRGVAQVLEELLHQ